MVKSNDFLVKKADYSQTSLVPGSSQVLRPLEAGEALLKVDRFAMTANNITYAALGDALRYWEFFPAAEGWGNVPVWGFADVVESQCEGLAVGERFYGYYPMSTHLRVEPRQVSPSSFMDGAAHRQSLSNIYNQYIRCSKDPLYSEETENLQMLLRPLFTTSFLLDDFFDDKRFFGSENMVLTSASSKTALGMAFLLNHNREQRKATYNVIGLTSESNLEFVKSLGCYDRVLSYEEVADLDASTPTSTVDFAGNGQILGRLHEHFADNLKYSCLVGASHWDQRKGLPENLPGPAPVMFFAPSQAEKRLKEWGGIEFQQKLAGVWEQFLNFVGAWIKVEEGRGPESVEKVYQDVLAGRSNPQMGHVLSLLDE